MSEYEAFAQRPVYANSEVQSLSLSAEERNAAIARIAVNGVGIIADCVPGVIDPSLPLDMVSTATRIVGKVPAVARRIKLVDKVVSFVERFDPTPDVPMIATWGFTGAEIPLPLIPTSAPLRLYQMGKDIMRLWRGSSSSPSK